MSVKESSDELNPTVTAPAVAVPATRGPRTAKDYLALAIATCGVGYLPLAPGTWGSLLAVGLYLVIEFLGARFIRNFAGPNSFLLFAPVSVFIAAELLLITVVTLVGIWAGSRAEKLFARKDPGKVVVDEVAGQLIALLPVLPKVDPGWLSILTAFVAFRLFDIIKPYPARRLESLESGLGIMADDIVAGAYGAVVVSVFVLVRWLI
jgi:phosphatidylglycerophosphatase A